MLRSLMLESPTVTTFILIYLGIMNLVAFLVMGIDKLKAKRRGFRVPEAILFLLAIAGGSIGAILAMYIFRHKTRHHSFTIGMPVILVLQLILAAFLYFGPLNISTI